MTRYLAIEKVRFGDRLTTTIDVDEAAAQCLVPPLLLQPLVENAVRHGIASVVEGGTIDIVATLRTTACCASVIDNPADPDRPTARREHRPAERPRAARAPCRTAAPCCRRDEAEGRFRVSIELPR